MSDTTSTSKADRGSEGSECPIERKSEIDRDEGTGMQNECKKVIAERNVIEKNKKVEDNILQINHQRQRILMEANYEKEKRLEELEKEINDQKTQHQEGIYWLRMQLETSRKEKNEADKRIVEFQKELRRLTTIPKARNICLDHTLSDSTGDGNEKYILIVELQNRLEKFESSFGVMENQMSMMKSSSSEIVKSLKEEIAGLMEDRTSSELDLLNKLSELENESRRAQLEYTMELQKKDEIIESLRNDETCSTSGNGTMIYDGSSSTDTTKNSISGSGTRLNDRLNDRTLSLIRGGMDQSSVVLRLEGQNAELQRKLYKANNELKDLKSGSKALNNSESIQCLSEERRAIDLSMDKLKTAMGSTTSAVSKLEGLVKKVETDDDPGAQKQKKRMLSVLESASLINEEVKLSVLLTELKLRNEFECLKKNKLAVEWGDKASLMKKQVVNDFEKIQKDALAELGKAGVEFSRQVKDLGKRIEADNRAKNRNSKSRSSYITSMDKFHGLNRLNQLISSSQVDNFSGDGSESTGDRVMISRNVLNLLEKELLQSAERIKAKNKKIGSLKEDLERSKIRETRLKKELRDSIKRNASGKSFKNVNDTRQTKENDRKDSMLSKSIPREIHTTMEDQSTLSPAVSPGQQERRKLSVKLLNGETRRRRKGMSDDSQDGGTNPAKAPVHLLKPGDRVNSIGFVPSPSRVGNSSNSNATSTTKQLSHASRRVQPTSHDIKKLVFLPPCFFEDLKEVS